MPLLRASVPGSIRTCVVMMAMFACASSAFAGGGTPLGSGFSYQGVLQSSGAPYSGTADLRFQMFYQAVGGPAVAAAQTVPGQTIIDGQFTVTLDFGTMDFTGEERWLAIEVCAPSTGGVGPWTPLTPRQRIAPTPYALFALNATVSGAQPNLVQFGNAGNQYNGSSMDIDGNTLRVHPVLHAVGMGAPPDGGSRLRVAADTDDHGVWVTANGNGSAIRAEQSSPVGLAGQFIGNSAFSGNVGIGTNTPEDRLHIVDGGVLVDQSGVGGTSLMHRNSGQMVGTFGEALFSGNLWLFIGNWNAAGLALGTSSTPGSSTARLFITPAGNVGVGTFSPSAKLHVGGVAGVDGVRFPDGTLQTTAAVGGGRLFASGSITGSMGTNINNATPTWQFAGPTTSITLAAGQRLVMQVSAALGTTNPAGSLFEIDLGYQPSGGGTIFNFNGGSYLVLRTPAGLRNAWALHTHATGLAAGTYTVGVVIRNMSAALNDNDFIQGSYMIFSAP